MEAPFMRAFRKTVSTRSEQRKGTPLRKRTNKDNFRCLITIWSIGIARRGLNELIFVKTSNLTKINIFHFFFLPVAQNLPVRIPTYFTSMGHKY